MIWEGKRGQGKAHLSNERGAEEERENTTNLLEMISQLDNRGGFEHSLLIDNQLSMLQRVDVALNEE